MWLSRRRAIAGVAVLAAVSLAGCGTGQGAAQGGAGSGAAGNANGQVAAQGPGNWTGGNGLRTNRGGFAGGSPFEAVSQVLGISNTELMNDLRGGQSILAIAQQKGLSEQSLISKLEAAYKAQLDEQVKAGRLSAQREQQMINRYDQNLPAMVERKGLPQGRTFGGRGGPGGQAGSSNGAAGTSNTNT
ncbi:hypothetical protein [Alicyclobacillus macrosporangiidus]|uniref:hypothetical protein n=1 Tax=Alicyclobacillus macrosporangiidus TaxID=392015 RepID=UPI0012DBE0AE|nr:hypothetical protein [Alicyclobacillus macrosporangiidus]